MRQPYTRAHVDADVTAIQSMTDRDCALLARGEMTEDEFMARRNECAARLCAIRAWIEKIETQATEH